VVNDRGDGGTNVVSAMHRYCKGDVGLAQDDEVHGLEGVGMWKRKKGVGRGGKMSGM
jgi:hypothetical protein